MLVWRDMWPVMAPLLSRPFFPGGGLCNEGDGDGDGGGGGDAGGDAGGGDADAGGGDAGGDAAEQVDKRIMLDRLSNQKNEYEAKMRELEKKVEAAGAAGEEKPKDEEARYTDLVDKHTGLSDEFALYKAEMETKSALLIAGVTEPAGQGLVLHRYNQIPESERPSLGVWLQTDAKADRYLAPVFGKPEAPKEPEEQSQQGSSFWSSPNNGVTIARPDLPASVKLTDVAGKSYAEKIKLVGSHEKLEKLYGLRPGGLPRPRKKANG